MKSKKYYFDFYVCQTNSGNPIAPALNTHSLLNELHRKFTANDTSVREIAGVAYETRFIEPTPYGFRGTIAKHRTNDLPHAAKPGGEEREINLEPHENLIEKAHYHFYSDHSLLILQRNFFCIGATNFGRYLSINGYVTILNPVIQPADLELMMSGKMQVKRAQVRIARPTNVELFQKFDHDFNNSIYQTLNGTAAAVLNITLRGDSRSTKGEKRYLLPTIKEAFIEMQRAFDVRRCKIDLEDVDTCIAHPVDLVADRLCYSSEIQSVGRYPPESDLWEALDRAREARSGDLATYFGHPEGERVI